MICVDNSTATCPSRQQMFIPQTSALMETAWMQFPNTSKILRLPKTSICRSDIWNVTCENSESPARVDVPSMNKLWQHEQQEETMCEHHHRRYEGTKTCPDPNKHRIYKHNTVVVLMLTISQANWESGNSKYITCHLFSQTTSGC